MNPRMLLSMVFSLVVLASGCTLPWLRRPSVESFPVAFVTPPTKEQIIGAVNANTWRVHQLQADVTIRVQGVGLRGNLAVERPRRVRLRAGLMGIPGTGVDVGSNDDLFWIWSEQNQPPGVYYAHHQTFAQSPAHRLMPVDPGWLIEALGVVELDPGGLHEGPYQRVAGKVELHSHRQSASGDMTQITVVHEQYGWVLEQYLYDAGGQLIASSRASQQRYYPAEGVTLPQHIEIQIAPGQPTQLSFHVDVPNYQINRLVGDSQQLWSLPQPVGFPLIDMADPQFNPIVQLPPRFVPRHTSSTYDSPRTGFRPHFRRLLR